MNSRPAKLAIVGGGAAGMFAAAVAAEARLGAVLVERKARLGAKVLMTANGRCNFTRDLDERRFLADLAPSPTAGFAAEALRECPPRRIIAAFRSLGVPLRRMPDGRMFPADGKAATIVHAFGDRLREAELPIITNASVKEILKLGPHRLLVRTAAFDLAAENVLIATGGASFPKTGSVGDGQEFARRLGHTIVPLRPGLTGIDYAVPEVTALAGRRFEDGFARLLSAQGGTLFETRGEVDCERFGLSGGAVYNCQRFLAHRPAGDCVLEVGFGRKRFRVVNPHPRPLKEAIVTIGGVDTGEVDAHTMESKLVPGLFFAGEVLDLDGPTGGYNLTLAFATAAKAVESIASSRGRNGHML